MVVTDNRLKKLGFKERNIMYDNKPRTIWVIGKHKTERGKYDDTIIYDPVKGTITADYGGMLRDTQYKTIESTWDVKQFLKENPHKILEES